MDGRRTDRGRQQRPYATLPDGGCELHVGVGVSRNYGIYEDTRWFSRPRAIVATARIDNVNKEERLGCKRTWHEQREGIASTLHQTIEAWKTRAEPVAILDKYEVESMAFWWNITSFVKAGPIADMVASRTSVAHGSHLRQLRRNILQRPTFAKRDMAPCYTADTRKHALVNTPDHSEPMARCKASTGMERSNGGFGCGTEHIYDEDPSATYCLTGSEYVWASPRPEQKETGEGGKWSRLKKEQHQ